jgi:hypothetical protein
MLKKSSPLKQLGQMEPSLAGSIYVRSKPGIDGPWVCPFQNCVRPMFGSILPSSFRGEDFLNSSQSETIIALWRPYLLVKRNEMEKLYRGPYIDAYCQVWFHLAKLFLFFFILILFVLYFKNYLEIDVKFIAKMCSISRSTYPAILMMKKGK